MGKTSLHGAILASVLAAPGVLCAGAGDSLSLTYLSQSNRGVLHAEAWPPAGDQVLSTAAAAGSAAAAEDESAALRDAMSSLAAARPPRGSGRAGQRGKPRPRLKPLRGLDRSAGGALGPIQRMGWGENRRPTEETPSLGQLRAARSRSAKAAAAMRLEAGSAGAAQAFGGQAAAASVSLGAPETASGPPEVGPSGNIFPWQ